MSPPGDKLQRRRGQLQATTSATRIDWDGEMAPQHTCPANQNNKTQRQFAQPSLPRPNDPSCASPAIFPLADLLTWHGLDFESPSSLVCDRCVPRTAVPAPMRDLFERARRVNTGTGRIQEIRLVSSVDFQIAAPLIGDPRDACDAIGYRRRYELGTWVRQPKKNVDPPSWV